MLIKLIFYVNKVEIISKYGYPVEEHFTITPDGYVLRLHRIPYGISFENTTTKGIAFLMHGLLSSSVDWILTGPNYGLGYVLADKGYDVWMGNARGNSQSRNHTTLNPNDNAKFWNFSWHEIGIYDLPTMIEYILLKTKQKNLIYIGHSQGNTAFYVMASMRPQYNSKIKVQLSLAPVAYMGHLKSPLIRFFVSLLRTEHKLFLDLFGAYELLANSGIFTVLATILCRDASITQILCTNIWFLLGGYSPHQINATMLPTLLAHTPAGGSIRQIVHFGQLVKSNDFRQYDFDFENIHKYKSFTPPRYDLQKITAPVYLIYSLNDALAAEVDVLRLCKSIGTSCKEKFIIADHTFNHLDFMYGIRVRELVYDKLLEFMALYK